MLQLRELNSPCVLFYSPGRDLAYCGPININYALDYLQHLLETEPIWLQEYFTALNIDKDEFIGTVNMFIASLEQELRGESVQSTPFFSAPPGHKILILAAVAQIFIGETIKGRRDVLSENAVKELDPEVFYKKCLPIVRRFMIRPTFTTRMMMLFNRMLFALQQAWTRFWRR